jgi:hypothetical protein
MKLLPPIVRETRRIFMVSVMGLSSVAWNRC